MKWVIFAAALLFGVPWIAGRAAASARARALVVTAIAFELFNPQHINVASDETYRGDSRGFEITTVDLLLLALLLAQRRRGVRPAATHRFRVARALYLTTVLVSAFTGHDPFRSLFSVWKLVRMFFAFSVLAGAFQELELANAALVGLAYGVVSQGLQALWQKYAYHMVRVVGSQSHPNSLAMIVNFISPVALALLLDKGRSRLTLLVVAFAGMCDVFSLSRGGMMMFVLSSVLVIAMSSLRGMTPRKVKVVVSLFLGGVAALLKSLETIIKRFTEAPKESELARKLFNKAAHAMADDFTFGVGINMYSWTLSHKGYAERFNIEPGDRSGIAHHIYWLTAAETGYVGCAAYLFMLATVLIAALRLVWRRDVTGDISIGIAAGLAITYTQGTAEWIARQTNMSYLFWLFAAMISAFHARGAARA